MKTIKTIHSKMSVCMLLLLTLVSGFKSLAQKKDSLTHRYLSFGIRTSKDLGAEFMDPILSSFIVNVDPVKYLRLEAQYGKYRSEEEYPFVGYNNQGTYTVMLSPEYKASKMSAGVFGMLPLEKTRIYTGYRLTKISSSDEYVSVPFGNSAPVLYTRSGEGIDHSVVLGGEHFFGSRFSIGAELGVHRYKEKIRDSSPGSIATVGQARFTEASLLFRFYLL